MSHKVFICHSSKDKAVADAACAALEAHRIPCWIAPRDILAGDEYATSAISALDETEIVLLIFSVGSNYSARVRREVERAVSQGKILVLLRLDDTQLSGELEYCCANTNSVDATIGSAEANLAELRTAISRLLAKQEKWAPPPPVTPEPEDTSTTPPTTQPRQVANTQTRSEQPPVTTGHKVFICHSSKDKLVADAACAALEAHRIPCWIAPRDITPGDEYAASIIDALDECQIVLLIFSAHSNDSTQCRREIERAVSKEKILIPFRIEDVMPSRAMEFHLMSTHWLDALTPPREQRLSDLCNTITKIVNQQSPTVLWRRQEESLEQSFEKQGAKQVTLPDSSQADKEQQEKARAIIKEAMKEVGIDGVILIEESFTTETTLSICAGMQFDRGFVSPYFVTDSENGQAVLENPAILISRQPISTGEQIAPVLKLALVASRPLLIIAESFSEAAVATIVKNMSKFQELKVCAVMSPSIGERRYAIQEDLAILTDCNVIGGDNGLGLESLKLEQLGFASRAIIDAETTTLLDTKVDPVRATHRIKYLRTEIQKTTSDYDRGKLTDRLVALINGIALIRAGGRTVAQIQSNTQHLQHALREIRAANPIPSK
jgi:hypothetical protein